MRPAIHPRLNNGPFDDPGLFISFLFEPRAILFDLGNLDALSTRDILKVDYAFVTHTHMDHFIGFDRLLRLFLNREKRLHLFGPEGFLRNVEGKLAGYTWNLIPDYPNRFSIHATEIDSDHAFSRIYHARHKFAASGPIRREPFTGVACAEPGWTVSAVILEHRVPSLGFALTERFHVNIRKEALAALKLEVGPWLSEFKKALYRGDDPNSEFRVPNVKASSDRRVFRLEALAEKICTISPGQKIAYISDVRYSPEAESKIAAFAADSDHLFIEAAFLDTEREVAERKCHLTARQAGIIAGKAGARQLTVFHFSPRYSGRQEELEKEALAAYHEYR